MSTVNLGELLNLVGLSTGVVLYAMLLAMVIRARRTAGAASAFDPLLLLTSILGLVWNLCALPAYVLPKFGIEGPFPFLSGDRIRRARPAAGGRRCTRCCAAGATAPAASSSASSASSRTR